MTWPLFGNEIGKRLPSQSLWLGQFIVSVRGKCPSRTWLKNDTALTCHDTYRIRSDYRTRWPVSILLCGSRYTMQLFNRYIRTTAVTRGRKNYYIRLTKRVVGTNGFGDITKSVSGGPLSRLFLLIFVFPLCHQNTSYSVYALHLILATGR